MTSGPKPPRPSQRGWKIIVLSLLGVIAIGFAVWMAGVLSDPFRNDANLVASKPQNWTGPPNASVTQRASEMFWRLTTRVSPNRTIRVSPFARLEKCSIESLLSSATELSGRKYYLEARLSGVVIPFGTTNILGPQEWRQAIEQAILAGAPQLPAGAPREYKPQPLILLEFDKNILLILSPETAARYQSNHPQLKQL